MGRILGVVPAAGRSTRIGNPKPLLDADGASFLERTVAALRDGGCDAVVVGVREPRGPIHAMATRAGGRPLVPSRIDDGPIASVRAALLWAEGDWAESDDGGGELPDALVLLPVDHPRVRSETVRVLVETFREESVPLVLVEHRGRTGHPALFARPLFGELRDPELAEGARTVVQRHRDSASLVEVDDPGVLVDIDTLAEYRRHFPRSYRKRFQKW